MDIQNILSSFADTQQLHLQHNGGTSMETNFINLPRV